MPILERSENLGSIDAGFAVNDLGELARVDGCLNRRLSKLTFAVCACALQILSSSVTRAEDDFEREPIKYTASRPQNVVSQLQKRIDVGDARLDFDSQYGYLRSILKALSVPESSQTLVFSKTSFQRHRIAPKTPRALYFNDEVYVGYCSDGDVVELSAIDANLGTVFYTLDQAPAKAPRFTRQGDSCLICHASSHNQGVPGQLLRSVYPDANGFPILASGSFRVDQTTPLKNRWGGWYVTGSHGKQKHLGNLIIADKRIPEEVDNSAGMNVTNLKGRFDDSKYLTTHSDIVALMVMEHQTMGQNLISAANFQTRMALYQEAALNRDLKQPTGYRWGSTTSRIKAAGEPLVEFLLFSEEAELTEQIKGSTPFAKEFSSRGPRDKCGRSLRDFDLRSRLFRYPCSYLVYSPAFNSLPTEVKEYVFKRLWDVLNGQDTSKEFGHLTIADRRAIAQILQDTKPDLAAYRKLAGQSAPR